MSDVAHVVGEGEIQQEQHHPRMCADFDQPRQLQARGYPLDAVTREALLVQHFPLALVLLLSESLLMGEFPSMLQVVPIRRLLLAPRDKQEEQDVRKP